MISNNASVSNVSEWAAFRQKAELKQLRQHPPEVQHLIQTPPTHMHAHVCGSSADEMRKEVVCHSNSKLS